MLKTLIQKHTHSWACVYEHSRLHTYGCWATELKIYTLVVVPPSYEGQCSDQRPDVKTQKPHVKRWGCDAPGTNAPRLPNHRAPDEGHSKLLGENRKPFPEFTCWVGTHPLNPMVSCLGHSHLTLSLSTSLCIHRKQEKLQNKTFNLKWRS